MAHGRMAVIGLTGGIASGKSAVARRLRERGVPIIDADLVAREVVAPGEASLAGIRAHFGPEVIGAGGALDRKRLAAIVFSDPGQLEALNAITHPAIMARVGQRLIALRRSGAAWVVYEAALILENDLAPGLDLLVVVICDPEVQVRRVMARDGLDEAAARRRLAAQTDNDTRRAAADVVIDNDHDEAALVARVDEVVEELDARFGDARAQERHSRLD